MSRPVRSRAVAALSAAVIATLATVASNVAIPAENEKTSAPTLKSTPAKTARQKPAKPAQQGKYTLQQLIARARRHYPGVAAARHAVDAMQRKLYQAKWAWVPRGKISAAFAPTPELRCLAPQIDGDTLTLTENPRGDLSASDMCLATTAKNFSLNFNGVFGRIQLDLGMPLYTFDKLGSAKRAATAGVQAKRAELDGAQQDVTLNVAKAYWALKLAREMLVTIREGRKHLDKNLDRLERELDAGEGEATVTDMLRLKTAKAEVDTRNLEARRFEQVAHASLSALTGIDLEALVIDDAVITVQDATVQPLAAYLTMARLKRPEIKMLLAAIEASEAKVSLERARLFPDLLLVGRVGIGGSTNTDDPHNTFFSDPLNFMTTGLALALEWNLNTVEQYGRLKEAAAEKRRAQAKQLEAVRGIELEIRKVYYELIEARDRLTSTDQGARAARAWLVAVSQNLSAGLAEPRDLVDALVAFFKLRLLQLQAIYDVNTGWTKLARSVGVSLEETSRANRDLRTR